VLFVANKSDRLPVNVRQEYLLQPEAFCAKHRLPPPQSFSTLKMSLKRDMYVKLATMAAFPNLRRLVHAMIMKQPPTEWIGTFRHFRQLGLIASDAGSLFKYGVGPPSNFRWHLLAADAKNYSVLWSQLLTKILTSTSNRQMTNCGHLPVHDACAYVQLDSFFHFSGHIPSKLYYLLLVIVNLQYE